MLALHIDGVFRDVTAEWNGYLVWGTSECLSWLLLINSVQTSHPTKFR